MNLENESRPTYKPILQRTLDAMVDAISWWWRPTPVRLLVGRGEPAWLEIDRHVPFAVIHSVLDRVGVVATEEDIRLLARIRTAATEKEAVALARAHNDRKLTEWPDSMAMQNSRH